jgi:hypothetical protein
MHKVYSIKVWVLITPFLIFGVMNFIRPAGFFIRDKGLFMHHLLKPRRRQAGILPENFCEIVDVLIAG